MPLTAQDQIHIHSPQLHSHLPITHTDKLIEDNLIGFFDCAKTVESRRSFSEDISQSKGASTVPSVSKRLAGV